MKKKFFLFLFFIPFLLFGSVKPVFYFFHMNGCPHCKEAEPLIKKLEKQHPEIEFKELEIGIMQNKFRFIAMLKKFKIKTAGVPLFVFNNKYVLGFKKGKTEIEVENLLKTLKNLPCTKESISILRENIDRAEKNFSNCVSKNPSEVDKCVQSEVLELNDVYLQTKQLVECKTLSLKNNQKIKSSIINFEKSLKKEEENQLKLHQSLCEFKNQKNCLNKTLFYSIALKKESILKLFEIFEYIF